MKKPDPAMGKDAHTTIETKDFFFFRTGLMLPTLPPPPSNDSPIGTYYHHFTPSVPPDKQGTLSDFSNAFTTLLTVWDAVSIPLLPSPHQGHFPNTKLPSPSPEKRERSSVTCFQGSLSQRTYGLYLSETIEFNDCFSPAHK